MYVPVHYVDIKEMSRIISNVPSTYSRAAFCLGEHTLKVPMALHQLNRTRLCQRLKTNSDVPSRAFVVLQGGSEFNRYCSDVQVAPFRQVLHYCCQVLSTQFSVCLFIIWRIEFRVVGILLSLGIWSIRAWFLWRTWCWQQQSTVVCSSTTKRICRLDGGVSRRSCLLRLVELCYDMQPANTRIAVCHLEMASRMNYVRNVKCMTWFIIQCVTNKQTEFCRALICDIILLLRFINL